jgi:hypothetical protein
MRCLERKNGEESSKNMNKCSECSDSFETEKALNVHKSWCEDKRGSMKNEYTCEECGDTFEDYDSRKVDNIKHRFCSRDCKDSSQEKGEFVECSWCSEELWRPKSQLSEMGDYSIDNHFCDKSCEKSWKRKHWTGEDHPSWDGGSPGHRGKSWPEMRRKALDRDGYCCRVCGMSREEHYDQYDMDLEVHHKIPAKGFDNVDDSNFLINLATTCASCHGTLDKISRRAANREPTIPV